MKKKLFMSMILLVAMSLSACFSKFQPFKALIRNAEVGNTAANTGTVDNTANNNTAAGTSERSIIIGHTSVSLKDIPTEWIEKAVEKLHILYGHTSHGSQVTSGMLGLTDFAGSPFIYEKVRQEGTIDLRDNPFNSNLDLGAPDNKAWAEETRNYLNTNKDINVVMWSWCGQLSKASSRYVRQYLDTMQALESEYPEVTFVYMTGHLNGTGEKGTLNRNNEAIRLFCRDNGKVLYDFADIESYDPDGKYYGDKYATDGCDYDSNGDRKPDKNWAVEWQETHNEGIDWYKCPSAHSQPVNANMKAYAAWWLFARISGWDGVQNERE